MTVELVAQTIQFILAPVVMISATGLLLLGVLTRYAAVNDRLRAMAAERIDVLRRAESGANPFDDERLGEIDAQLPTLVRRLRWLHDAVLALYLAVVVFVVSMFAIGLAAATGSGGLATASLLVFLGATLIMLAGVVLVVTEVMHAQRAIEYEVGRVAALTRRR